MRWKGVKCLLTYSGISVNINDMLKMVCAAFIFVLAAVACFVDAGPLPARNNPFDRANEDKLEVKMDKRFVSRYEPTLVKVLISGNEISADDYQGLVVTLDEGAGTTIGRTFYPEAPGIVILKTNLPGNPKVAVGVVEDSFSKESDGHYQNDYFICIENTDTIWVKDISKFTQLAVSIPWNEAATAAAGITIGENHFSLPTYSELIAIHPSAVKDHGINLDNIVINSSAAYWTRDTDGDQATVINFGIPAQNKTTVSKSEKQFCRPMLDLKTLEK